MRLLIQELRSRLQYKIVLPFLLLTLCVALAGSAIVFSLVANTWQERFNNQLAAVTRSANDALVSQEQANLQFLREVAFAGENTANGAPAVPDALAVDNQDGLAAALDPYFRVGARRSSVSLDRLIAFDRSGQTIVDFEREPGADANTYTTHPPSDFSNAWFVEQVLASASDDRGDKFAGFLRFTETQEVYFCTIAPVRQGDQVVGGLIAAMRVDNLLSLLARRSQAAVITMYDDLGNFLASTLSGDGDQNADMSDALYEQYLNNPEPFDQTVYSIENVDNREFQFAYVPMNVRGSTVGVLSPGLSRDYVVGAWGNTRNPIIGFIVLLMLLIVGLGVYIARLITAPLEELVLTARAVAGGDLYRRSKIRSRDEIGTLAETFNGMTDSLLISFTQIQAESNKRAAIMESIPDGIIVCDDDGAIQFINPATRTFLGLRDSDPAPIFLGDIPLVKLTEGVPGFDMQRASDLYTVGDFIVRLGLTEIEMVGNKHSGFVCVLQDMTTEVAMDRAKTNFIGTISHELRTPLTVIRGNADLLLRGLVGPLEAEQQDFIESIRQHTTNMTGLIANVILIASLDAGNLTTDLEPIDLERPIEEAAWQVRSMIKAKELTLTIDIPSNLPRVLADFDQVRTIVQQLIDNARRYTNEGEIRVRAAAEAQHMLVEVSDTGRGIPSAMHEQIFERFIRGDGVSEGINSSERGIGLGLAIVRQLVERQGGTIWVNSAPGHGSTFIFTLNYAHDSASPDNQTKSLATAA